MVRRTVVVLLMTVALGTGLSACGGSGGKQAGGSGLGSEPDTTVAGTWQPVTIAGYELPPEYPDGLERATITFDGAGSWSGSDGCNRLTGTYRFHGDGGIEATSGPQTLIGCANVPNGRALTSARQAQLDGAVLTLLDEHGGVLARYQRVATAAAT